MPKDELNKVLNELRNEGIYVELGTKRVDLRLEQKGVSGSTMGDIILLHSNPSRATVYEERTHAYIQQNPERYGIMFSEIGTAKEEMVVANSLLKNAKEYKLTDDEIMQTEYFLKDYTRKWNNANR